MTNLSRLVAWVPLAGAPAFLLFVLVSWSDLPPQLWVRFSFEGEPNRILPREMFAMHGTVAALTPALTAAWYLTVREGWRSPWVAALVGTSYGLTTSALAILWQIGRFNLQAPEPPSLGIALAVGAVAAIVGGGLAAVVRRNEAG